MPLRDPNHRPNDPGRTRPTWSPGESDESFALDEGRASWPLIPGYQVVSELGRGGVAVVYLARQVALNRFVALKVLLGGALATASDRERLRREAEAAAKLDHPNVIQIHDIGEYQGTLYLSLEYAPGGSLDRRVKRQPLPPDEAAGLVERLARGVQAAHDAGVVHRDLKPANVLLAASPRWATSVWPSSGTSRTA
jgi:eukaryotic-like serine/threonine-protein kinase